VWHGGPGRNFKEATPLPYTYRNIPQHLESCSRFWPSARKALAWGWRGKEEREEAGGLLGGRRRREAEGKKRSNCKVDIGVRQGVTMDSLKFHPRLPCLTLLRLIAVSVVAHPQGAWPAAVCYFFGHPKTYAYESRPTQEQRFRCRNDFQFFCFLVFNRKDFVQRCFCFCFLGAK
jgi:hypothetical protein